MDFSERGYPEKEAREKSSRILTLEQARESGILPLLHDGVFALGRVLDEHYVRISKAAIRALGRKNISSVADLLACTPEELDHIYGLTDQAKENIKRLFTSYGVQQGSHLEKDLAEVVKKNGAAWDAYVLSENADEPPMIDRLEQTPEVMHETRLGSPSSNSENAEKKRRKNRPSAIIRKLDRLPPRSNNTEQTSPGYSEAFDMHPRLQKLSPEEAVKQRYRQFSDTEREPDDLFDDAEIQTSKQREGQRLVMDEEYLAVAEVIGALDETDKNRLLRLVEQHAPFWTRHINTLESKLKEIHLLQEKMRPQSLLGDTAVKLKRNSDEWVKAKESLEDFKNAIKIIVLDILKIPEIRNIIRKHFPTDDQPLPHWQMPPGGTWHRRKPNLSELESGNSGERDT